MAEFDNAMRRNTHAIQTTERIKHIELVTLSAVNGRAGTRLATAGPSGRNTKGAVAGCIRDSPLNILTWSQ
jgi:hypothetical protein